MSHLQQGNSANAVLDWGSLVTCTGEWCRIGVDESPAAGEMVQMMVVLELISHLQQGNGACDMLNWG